MLSFTETRELHNRGEKTRVRGHLPRSGSPRRLSNGKRTTVIRGSMSASDRGSLFVISSNVRRVVVSTVTRQPAAAKALAVASARYIPALREGGYAHATYKR